ncbi:hypothetical protein TNCV_3188711 [Trichonephila clavipes]|nr:hypothetical protein TNCV_3188711 [Trichonephila clavipes]
MKFGCLGPENSEPRTTTSGTNKSTYASGQSAKKRLDGMYRYRWLYSFNTMPQLINRNDGRMVKSQSLVNYDQTFSIG